MKNRTYSLFQACVEEEDVVPSYAAWCMYRWCNYLFLQHTRISNRSQ